MNEEKRSFRKRCRQKNEALIGLDCEFNSEVICSKLVEMPEFKQAVTVMAFMPMSSEPDITGVIEYALGYGKVVCVPVCAKHRQLLAVQPVDWEKMVTRKFGMREPEEDNCILIDPNSIDVAIIPGLAFDAQCNRLGHGMGYYDNFLSQYGSEIVKVGVCYESQLYKSVPTDELDVPMDWVITEMTRYEIARR